MPTSHCTGLLHVSVGIEIERGPVSRASAAYPAGNLSLRLPYWLSIDFSQLPIRQEIVATFAILALFRPLSAAYPAECDRPFSFSSERFEEKLSS